MQNDITEKVRTVIVQADIVLHIVAAALLLVSCVFIFYYAALNLFEPSIDSVIRLVNDVLLGLIILELLWTVIRFLKKKKFVLGPFLAIGMIASVRRILLIEAMTTSVDHVPVEKLYEMGLSAMVVLVLMISYYLAVKAQSMEPKE